MKYLKYCLLLLVLFPLCFSSCEVEEDRTKLIEGYLDGEVPAVVFRNDGSFDGEEYMSDQNIGSEERFFDILDFNHVGGWVEIDGLPPHAIIDKMLINVKGGPSLTIVDALADEKGVIIIDDSGSGRFSRDLIALIRQRGVVSVKITGYSEDLRKGDHFFVVLKNDIDLLVTY